MGSKEARVQALERFDATIVRVESFADPTLATLLADLKQVREKFRAELDARAQVGRG